MSDQTRLTLYEQGLKAIEDNKEPWGFIDSGLFAKVLGELADLQRYSERLEKNCFEQFSVAEIKAHLTNLADMGQSLAGEYDDLAPELSFTIDQLSFALKNTLSDLIDDAWMECCKTGQGLDRSKLGKLPLGSCHCPRCIDEQGYRAAKAIGENIRDPWVEERLYGLRTDKPGCKLVPGFYVWNRITGERQFVGRFTSDTSLHTIEKLACTALVTKQNNLIDELNADRLETVSPGRQR